MPLRILNVEPAGYSAEARAVLRRFAQVDESEASREDLLALISAYDVLMVRLGHLVDRELLERATRLKAVVTPTTGLDHVDIDALNERGIALLSLRGERTFLDLVTSTAEHALGLLLALVRRIPAAFRDVCEGNWRRDAFVGHQLSGLILGVIGFGRLGTMMGRYGHALGMRVLAVDPFQAIEDPTVKQVDLGTLLSGADAISIHVPLSRETSPLLGPAEFQAIRPGAWLVNTSRGEVLDEASLLEALLCGRLAGAALDVLAGEARRVNGWPDAHPLIRYARAHDNLLITPHIGGASLEAMWATELFLAERLRAFCRSRGWA